MKNWVFFNRYLTVVR